MKIPVSQRRKSYRSNREALTSMVAADADLGDSEFPCEWEEELLRSEYTPDTFQAWLRLFAISTTVLLLWVMAGPPGAVADDCFMEGHSTLWARRITTAPTILLVVYTLLLRAAISAIPRAHYHKYHALLVVAWVVAAYSTAMGVEAWRDYMRATASPMSFGRQTPSCRAISHIHVARERRDGWLEHRVCKDTDPGKTWRTPQPFPAL
jgi:hypothetical protein